MAELFDAYKSSYGDVVEGSVRFSGLKHDFFLIAKADLLRRLVIERRLRQGGRVVRALDVGCGVGSLHPYLEGVFESLNGCDVSEDRAQSLQSADAPCGVSVSVRPGRSSAQRRQSRIPFSRDGIQ
jgi:predicted TPR repeat methyltransferase